MNESQPVPVDPTGTKLQPRAGKKGATPPPAEALHAQQPHSEEDVSAALAVVLADMEHQKKHGTMGAQVLRAGIPHKLGFNPMDLLPSVQALLEFWAKIRGGDKSNESAPEDGGNTGE